VAKLLSHTTQVTCFSSIYSDELRKNILVSGSCDTTVKIWDLDTNQCDKTLRGHRGQVNDVQISPDGAWIASCSNDKSVIVSLMKINYCKLFF
jgi:WD40 repeat protein